MRGGLDNPGLTRAQADALYALLTHNHDGAYAAAIHTHTASQITDFGATIAALGYKKPVSYTFTATLNFSLLTGAQIVQSTVTGLLSTDVLVECQPLADLPNNLGIGYARISADNTIRVSRDLRVTVLR